ncbi:hypothetical protein Stsp02_15520 [Streptomyces sp. NBRC 14336]|nr:hypothetical protein Stsp02_15520 [Streptomyces sp. NBRC 14336]
MPSRTTPEMERIIWDLLVRGDSHHEYFQAHRMYPYDKRCKRMKFGGFPPLGGAVAVRMSCALASDRVRGDLYLGHIGSCAARASTLAIHLNGCMERRSGDE